MSYDFITVDFETANKNNSSACSIGVVLVKNNEIYDTYHSYIKQTHFDESNIKIHGITYDHAKNAPAFPEVWEQVKHYFDGNSILVAHNAAFDMSVLKLCLMDHHIPIPEFNYLCSIPFSTCACRGRGIGNSLKDRTEYFGVELDSHHDALCDALACAKLVLKCIEAKRRKSFKSYCSTFSSIQIRNFTNLKPRKGFGKNSKFQNVRICDIEPNNPDCDDSSILYDQNIVFTGELATLTRRGAMQLAVNVGANIKSTVNRKTNYLVVGNQDKSIVGDDGMSNKEELAYALNKEGYEINIINENKFLDLLGEMRDATTI